MSLKSSPSWRTWTIISRDYRSRGITEFRKSWQNNRKTLWKSRLGYEAMQKNDWDTAGDHFRRARPTTYGTRQVHYLLALI